MLGHRSVACLGWVGFTWAFLLVLPSVPSLHAQTTGTVRGTVTRADNDAPIANVDVSVRGTGINAVTGRDGGYVLTDVPAGSQVIVLRRLGFGAQEVTVDVSAGGTHTADVSFEVTPIRLGEVVVSAVSRGPERIVEAPAAVSVVDVGVARDMSMTGQPARALASLPGVDVVQSGMLDYNVNARGLNSSLSRRVLVLQDGRDLAFTFLGSPSWGFMSNSLEDMASIEMVRGPGSALYGANAYNGVVSFTTPNARDQIGTRLTLSGGELSTARGDFRHGGVTRDGRVGYRFGAGYYRSDSWTVSRTTGDSSDLQREYSAATSDGAPKGIEAVSLFGQTLDAATRRALGDPDPVVGIYGSGRVDYYLRNGSVGTVEGGWARLENETFVTGIGRVQIDEFVRPWARVAWTAPRFSLMTWYSGENTTQPIRSLTSGIPIEINSSSIHAEGQFNILVGGGRGRIVFGASARNSLVDTEQTLLAPQFDDRSDQFYSVFGQMEWDLSSELKIVGAARFDDGSLYDAQFSPKAALVFSPSADHAIRATFNRAFQTPNQTEFFAQLIAGRPADFSLLEAGLRASPLGPALAGVPNGELFTNSSAVPVLAFGNENLEVETVNSFEVGYKGQVSDQIFVYVDAHFSRYKNFVTDLLPSVNPNFSAWTAPSAVPTAFAEALEQAVRDQLTAAGQALAAAGLARLPSSDATAIVVSYTNAGTVDELGLEIGGGLAVTPEIRLDGNYAFFDFEVDPTSVLPGDQLKANSPEHRVKLSGAYRGEQGFEARLSAEIVGSYDWGAGVFNGRIPSRQFVDLSAGYRVNNSLRVHLTATNVLDQQRFLMYGGSVIGRRVLGAVTATF